MEHKTDRRQAVKTLGGMLVAGTALAVPRGGQAQQKPPPKQAPAGESAKGDAPPRAAQPPQSPAPAVPSRGGTPPPQKLTPQQLQLEPLGRLLAPPAEGANLGASRLVSISGVRLGAASVTFKSRSGVSFQVDICKRDRGKGAHAPIASTAKYDLFVVNGGKGRKPTDRQLERTVDLLANTIKANEARVALRVLTLRQRLQRFPRGKFDVQPDATSAKATL